MAVWLAILVVSAKPVFMNNYQVYIIGAWLRAGGFTNSEHQLNLELLSHPDFPNLNSITESLKRMGVDASAVKVEKSLLPELEGSFLAYLIRDGLPSLVLVSDLRNTDQLITVVVDKGKQFQVSREEFLAQWNGIVVVVDERQRNIRDLLRPLKKFAPPVLLAVTILSSFFMGGVGLWNSATFLLTLLGFAVCGVIVAHELGSSVASKFCTEGKHTSCSAVLNSKAAKLPFDIGLSDVGITYFATLIVCWTLASLSGSLSTFVSVAAVISFLAIPFTLFSVAYQGLVVKKFCPLCLSVVAVLWLQAATLIPYASSITSNLAMADAAIFVGMGFVLVLLWNLLKPLLKLPNQNRALLLESVIFRRSYQLFLPWFSQAEILDLGTIPEIRMGNPNAPLKLLAISNPMCVPCAAAHQVYEELMARYPGKIHLAIRFYVPLNDRSDPRMAVAARLMELSFELPENSLTVAVNRWYRSQDYSAWIKEWGSLTAISEAALIAQKGWCLSNGIDQTPTLLVNGKVMPHYYRPADLASFIEPLLTQLEVHCQKTLAHEGALN